MKYLSLDLETTGLNPNQDQILQIGMVLDDLKDLKPIEELPKLNLYIKHSRLEGTGFAFQMNSEILKVIEGLSELPEGAQIVEAKKLTAGIHINQQTGEFAYTGNPVLQFFIDCGLLNAEQKLTVAGKNVAGFDIPFLPLAIKSCFMHKCIDVGPLFMKTSDTEVPGLQECLKRAKIKETVTHDALNDAIQVVKLVRAFYG